MAENKIQLCLKLAKNILITVGIEAHKIRSLKLNIVINVAQV